MRALSSQFQQLSLILLVFLIACSKKQSLETDRRSKPEQPANEQANVAATALVGGEISLNPSALRANLEKIFAAESSCSVTQDVSSRRQLRLLTRDEYNRSIKDLFRLYSDYRTAIPLEQKVLGFRNNSQLALISSDHAAAYDKTAKELAQELVSTHWSRISKCPVTEGSSCAEVFIRDYGPRIWRRPLADEEIRNLLTLHRVGSEISPASGMELVIRGLLSSPHFLYRSELGQEGKLTPYETASAMAYFFWGTTPDEQLISLAANGTLQEEKILMEQAQRLLSDARAKDGMKAFADAWLGYASVLNVNKDASRFPQFNYEARVNLAHETEDFFDYVVRNKKSGYEELFLAEYSFGDQKLAEYYQAEQTMEGELSKLSFPGQARRGLLGHGSILASLAYATETGPIQRGKFVREQLLCDILIPPPASLMIKPPAPREGATTRERFADHTSVPACQGCHVKIDGVGFSMEDFDAIGQFREMDNGKPVDASGQVFALDGKNVDIYGAAELSTALAGSVRAKKCFVVQSWRMAQGRLESADDVCALRQLSSEFIDKDMSLAQMLMKLITDPSYSQRSR